jgi:hypothetical protein
VSPAAQAAALPSGLPSQPAAHAIQEAIRHGQPVSYDANVQVEALAENRHKELFIESTDVPLVYDPDSAVPNDDEYFQVKNYRLSTLRVRPIFGKNIVGIHRKHLIAGHPRTVAVSHEGVVSTDNVGRIPAVVVRLSNGQRLDMAIGLTFVNENS